MRRAFPFSRVLALVMAVALPSLSMAATLFFEDFQTYVDPINGPQMRCSGPGGAGTYPFPDGWFLRNVDNRTPDAQVAYVNAAWEVREDFGLDVLNCVAFSTSFYSPVGSADDWMWTPLIGPIPGPTTQLTWRARNYDGAYRDGYEVRIMTAPATPSGGTGVIGNQITSSTVVFSTTAEATTWTTHAVSLAAYTGQSIYIGFRNNSNDKFLLVIDDVKVEEVVNFDPDLLAVDQTPVQGYAKLPAPLGYDFDLQAQVRNPGLNSLTGVVVDADLLVDGAPVHALASTPIALASGATQTVSVGSSTYDQIGTWSVEAMVSATEGDQNPGNSALSQNLTVVTADELTRAEGTVTNALGIGAGNGGELGIDFTVPQAAVLRGARIAMNNVDVLPDGDPDDGDGVGDFNGYTLSMVLRGWNAAPAPDGEPGTLMATATATIAADAAIGPLSVEFDFGGVALAPGRYLLAVVEPITPQPRMMTLHTMPQRFLPGTVWVNWPTSPLGGWGNIEEFSIQRTLDITAILGLPVHEPVAQADAFTVPQSGTFAGDVSANDTPSDDGGNVWSVTTPPASGTLVMQTSGAFDYTPAPEAAGTTVTFGYTLCDVDDDCSTATAELQVQVNLPVAQDDAFSVPSTGAFNGDVSANDTPSDDGGNVWSVTAPPASGTLSMQPSGAFEYTPAPGASGSSVTFGYSLCDANADCSTANAELQIQVNVPVAVDDSFAVPSDGVFAGNVALNDTPSDDGGNVWSVATPPASGVLVLQPDGAFQYTPAAAAAGTTVTFTYSLCDTDTNCSTATAELQVGVNIPVAQDDSFTASPAGVLSADVSLNDTPSEDGGNVWSVVNAPATGTLALQPAGAFTYTPDAGAAGTTLTFEYSLCDVDNNCDTASVELQVLPVPIFSDSFEEAP